MGSPVTFEVVRVDVSRSSPTFRRSQNDHGPSRSERFTRFSGLFLVPSDLGDTLLEGGGHSLVHTVQVGTFNKVGSPAVTDHECLEFFVRDSSEDCRVVNLVPKQVVNVSKAVYSERMAGRTRSSARREVQHHRS